MDSTKEKSPQKRSYNRSLSPRQKTFISAYLATNCATKAAIEAGYSAKSAAWQGNYLLKHPKVSKEINEKLKSSLEKYDITAERVLQEIAILAFSDVRKAYGENGSLLSMKDMPENIARAVSGVDIDELFEGTGQDREQVGFTKKVRLWDKRAALELLAKYLKLLTDKVEIDISDDLASRLDNARKRAHGKKA